MTMATSKEDEMIPSRVSVWDSHQLDSGIFDVFKAQVQAIISYLPAGICSRIEPEINAVIKSALWILSVEKSCSTFGQKLLHLRYSDSTPLYKLRMLGALKILPSYIKDRLDFILKLFNFSNHETNSAKIVEKLETLFNLLNIVSFVLFLQRGGASTFLERLLKIRPVTTLKPPERSIGYSFMTRELLWHGLIELLVLIIPLLNYHSMKRVLGKLIKGKKEGEVDKNYKLTINTRCPVCKLHPVIPSNMGCSHIFCHYCLAGSRLADSKFECPECGFSDPDPSAMKEITM